MQVTSIQDGVIIDHVPAGTALKVLEYLAIDPAHTRLALIMNAPSHKFGTKDMIKIESQQRHQGCTGVDDIDLNVLGLVAPQATVDVVQGGEIRKKLHPTMPDHVVNIITCGNPRCVTTSERGLVQRFHRMDTPRGEYRCDYCDEEAKF
ncbi:aspartate carbamoyltransferase regulatory subunit [Bifidobacterium gallicum]|uniref:Aspartate carbamoyltransferase n=1 Tax=Bifidobacterium gallicum DSM 20093 = LMG 11596 TaxID=561180 RepID=D1NSH5_9BIFI|nr:aspartate carbamoyltransferase regulatory subunit [Bifidobacterium gallicum]EFA23627.1 aspartate carbamoyltransferase regulatory chain, allosteric domain protein [Bifidobacterium gallicum DSM 20093 = LMG 11596]KFI58688.1 aspartate carbamoyltransferase [Bifidobacterium gallicum DSM 20093 = LMG 11596]